MLINYMPKKKKRKGYLTTRKAKGRALVSLANTTKGGKGRISKRKRARSFKKK